MASRILDTRDLVENANVRDCLSALEDYAKKANKPIEWGSNKWRSVLDYCDSDENASSVISVYYAVEELKALAEIHEVSGEYEFGETLIPVDEWEDYCEDLLKDIGDLPRDLPWYIVIDWEATAANIAEDYTIINYAGDEYYIRHT